MSKDLTLRLPTVIGKPLSKAINRVLRLQLQVEYWKGVGKTYKPPTGGLLPVENSSGGFLRAIVDLALEYAQPRQRSSWMLIGEPSSASKVLGDYLEFNGLDAHVGILEDALEVAWNSGDAAYDICDRRLKLTFAAVGPVDVILNQAMLEHIVDPVTAIDNMLALLNPGGIIVVQTCNSYIGIHRYPIDTLRFHSDFFCNYTSTCRWSVLLVTRMAARFSPSCAVSRAT